MTVVEDDLEDLWQMGSFDEELHRLFKQIGDKVFCAWMAATAPPRRFPSVPRERIIESSAMGKGRWFVRMSGNVGLYATPFQEVYFQLASRRPSAPDRMETEAAEQATMKDIRNMLRYIDADALTVMLTPGDEPMADLQESMV